MITTALCVMVCICVTLLVNQQLLVSAFEYADQFLNPLFVDQDCCTICLRAFIASHWTSNRLLVIACIYALVQSADESSSTMGP